MERFGSTTSTSGKHHAAQGTDISLSALTVDGSSIAGFRPTSTNYSVELPAGTTVAPTVAATTTDTNASAVVTAATSIPGTTTIAITSQDGSATRTISIAWTLGQHQHQHNTLLQHRAKTVQMSSLCTVMLIQASPPT